MTGYDEERGRAIIHPEKRRFAMRSREYVIQAGDTLGSIAEREMGAASSWPTLYAMNRDAMHREQARRGMKEELRGPN